MTTFEFQTRIIHLSDFISHFAKKYAKNEEDAHDLAQETILRAFQNFDKFRSNTNLKGWLRIIMRNIFINGYRRRALQLIEYNSDSYLVQDGETDMYSPDAILQTKQIEKAIASLSPGFKIPFERHCSGFKYQEIADEMNLPVGTIKSRIFQARKLVAQQISHA